MNREVRCIMKKKNKILIIVVVAVAFAATVLIKSTCDKRVPFSRLHSVLDYGAEDIGAIAFVFYDVIYGDDVGFVKNIELKLILGDKKLVKKHFKISNVPVEAGRSYIDKVYKALPDVRGQEGPEHMIGSLNETGLVFFTKDGRMFLTELIDFWRSDKPEMWVAKIPCKELGPILTELFEKYGF
jgi:hypothetical protein